MTLILGVGNVTLDIVNVVETYPPEDAEVRAVAHYAARGGNSANTLVVLRQLGHQCSWAGTLADDLESRPILEDFARYGIDLGGARLGLAGKTPASYVTLSRKTGSRTIVHYRELPEYRAEDFRALDLGQYDWMHLEGRNVQELAAMLEHTRRVRPDLRVSLEVEKDRDGIAALFPHADVLLFSRSYARQRGAVDARVFLCEIHRTTPGADLICAWGESGAFALDRHGVFHATDAFPPPELVDTLGAGDVFNAGIIDALVRDKPLGDALVAAARLAGRKCGQFGLAGLADPARKP